MVGGVILDVLAALLMLSPFAIMAMPDPGARRRRVPGPVGPLDVMAARWRGRRTTRRVNRARRAQTRAHRGRHRALVMAGYPATPLLARLAPANGWRHDLVGEDRLNLPAALSESRAVWQRHGSRAEVLAALFELP